MRKEITVEMTPRYTEVRCNRCGKEMKLHKGMPLEDFIAVDKEWGYFSKQDGVRMQFDLCEDCVMELITGFAIPPQMEECKEF